MRCHAIILFTCLAVSSRLVVEGAHVKYELLGPITSCWMGQDKQGGYNIEQRAGKGLSLTRGRGQNGHIPKVLQGIVAQVCIKCT
jgi:hypothetical protein